MRDYDRDCVDVKGQSGPSSHDYMDRHSKSDDGYILIQFCYMMQSNGEGRAIHQMLLRGLLDHICCTSHVNPFASKNSLKMTESIAQQLMIMLCLAREKGSLNVIEKVLSVIITLYISYYESNPL